MKIFFLLFLSFNTHAGLLDFFSIYQANQAYENQDYQTAGEKYSTINHDSARLNQANSLYKQGLYKQSLKQYQQVKQADLSFERLYNSGNAYAKSGQINQAIDSYESALKLKQDADALFNLALVKKQKKRRTKNKEDKQKKHNKQKNKSQKNKTQEKPTNKQQQRQKLDGIKQQRWEKSLNKKLRTLMIPLNQPDEDNEQNPW